MIPAPYLLYLGHSDDEVGIKTSRGLAIFRPLDCVGEWRHDDSPLTLNLPRMDAVQARAAGAQTLVLRHRQCRRPARRGADPGCAGGDRGRDERRLGAPPAAARRAAAGPRCDRDGGRLVRRARSPGASAGRHRPVARGQPPADRRHRLLGRQDVRHVAAPTGTPRARRRGRFPRDGADRYPDRGRRRPRSTRWWRISFPARSK